MLVSQKYHSTLSSVLTEDGKNPNAIPSLIHTTIHADFPSNSIIFHSCIWSKITDVSHEMMSNILQQL